MLPGLEPKAPGVDEHGLSPVSLVGYGLSGTKLHRGILAAKAEVTASRVDANGLLLALRVIPKLDWTVPADKRKPWRFEFLKYLIHGPTLREAGEALKRADPDGIEIPPEAEWKEWADLPVDGVLFDVREPSPFAGEPRGVIIWFHSLGGLALEEACLTELQRRGWLIAVASFPWGMEPDLSLTLVGERDEDVAPAAKVAALAIDRHLAAAAYAAEAVRDYFYERSPAYKDKPLILWGASAGSFCVPAVAARLGSSVKGAILVGSGANLLAVSQGSTFFDGGVKIAYPRETRAGSAMAEQDRRARLKESLLREYAKATTLDPLATAAWLRGVPVLMLHGRTDEIVPAALGDDLWERLGKPERWVFSAGHEAMFWRLSSQATHIADWVDATLPRTERSTAP